MFNLRDLRLPMHVPNQPVEAYPPREADSIARFLDACRRADAFVWSSPTYHGTISGLVKNALDMLDLLMADTPAYLTGKPVGLIAIADSGAHSAMASAAHELRAWLAPTRLTFTAEDFTGEVALAEPAPRRRAGRLVRELLGFVGVETADVSALTGPARPS